MKYGGILMSSKSAYINFLNTATTAFKNTMEDETSEYLTYFTSAGIIVGKEEKEKPFEYQNFEELTEKMIQVHKKSSLTLPLIASSLYNHDAKKKDENYAANDHPAIILKDVRILTEQNTIFNTEQFILFADQIVGVVPGKLDLDQF